jgi:hypothetical protein
LDSAINHVSEEELRIDFNNLENVEMPRWHETHDFDNGANVTITTASFCYIMSLDNAHNRFNIFHVDRGDNYKKREYGKN